MHFTFYFAFKMLVECLKISFNLTFKFKLRPNITFKSCNHDYMLNEIQLTVFKYLPLRTVSRIWGYMTSIYLPVFMRTSIIGCYSRAFNCQITEAEVEDLRLYPNLRQFFTRSLKPGLRPIHPGNNLVSPVDGTILHFCEVTNGNVEQVKGVTFSVRSFLGPLNCPAKPGSESIIVPGNNLKRYQQDLMVNKDGSTRLYNCVIYLAPGDYHRFHSPANWQVNFRRHFPGHLLSVRPSFVGRIRGLFTINERVSYLGQWAHGFFSMTAVGATNVGSVKTYFDTDLKTNQFNWNSSRYFDKDFDSGVSFEKGGAFGEFNLGSTIVLLFEAPKNWRFTLEPGEKVKYGQLLMTPKTKYCTKKNDIL